MELNLKNKTVLITGSSRGIGKAIAQSLFNEGCNIILNGRNKNHLKNTVKMFGENTKFFDCDVTDFHSCKKLISNIVKSYGSLDIVICNVGNGKSVKPGKENQSEWIKMFNQNFLSATNIIESSKKELQKTNGNIICISSIAGIERTGAPVTYAVAKAALNAYVQNISKPLAKMNIRINAVAPGNILFEGSIWKKKMLENPHLIKKMLENNVSLNRFGTPNEIGDIVTFLASEKASFITGTIFVVDGGQIHS